METLKQFSIHPEQRADGTLPYPFFINERGEVGRQDFWKGKPKKLIGFSPITKPKSVDGEISFDDFLRDPQKAVGLYPIFEHEDGEWFTYQDKIATVHE